MFSSTQGREGRSSSPARDGAVNAQMQKGCYIESGII